VKTFKIDAHRRTWKTAQLTDEELFTGSLTALHRSVVAVERPELVIRGAEMLAADGVALDRSSH
jgi:hypothetical protein